MPFKKIVKDTADTNAHITSDKIAPMSVGGLNESNVPSYEVTKLTLEQERKMEADISKQTAIIEKETAVFVKRQKLRPDEFGLVPPTAEEGPNEEIARLVAAKIWNCVCYNEWFAFFTQETLQERVNCATRHDYRMLMELYSIPTLDAATDLSVLSLVDVVIVGDNSYSMRTSGSRQMDGTAKKTEDYRPEYDEIYKKECAESAPGKLVVNFNDVTRWESMITQVEVGAFITTLFDDDGVSVRFLNEDPRLYGVKMDGIRTPEDVKKLFSKGIIPNL